MVGTFKGRAVSRPCVGSTGSIRLKMKDIRLHYQSHLKKNCKLNLTQRLPGLILNSMSFHNTMHVDSPKKTSKRVSAVNQNGGRYMLSPGALSFHIRQSVVVLRGDLKGIRMFPGHMAQETAIRWSAGCPSKTLLTSFQLKDRGVNF